MHVSWLVGWLVGWVCIGTLALNRYNENLHYVATYQLHDGLGTVGEDLLHEFQEVVGEAVDHREPHFFIAMVLEPQSPDTVWCIGLQVLEPERECVYVRAMKRVSQ
jgi:hypothetical protein